MANQNGLLIDLRFTHIADRLVPDRSPCGRAAVTQGGILVPDSVFGRVMDFPDANDYCTLGGAEDDVDNALTVEAWVYARSLETDASRAPVVSQHDAGDGWELRGAEQPSFMVTINGSHRSAVASASLSVGVWTHLAGTYDGEYLRIYVDGQLSGEAAYSGSIDRAQAAAAIRRNPYWTSRRFDGRIAGVRLYDRAVDAAEAAANRAEDLAEAQPGLQGEPRLFLPLRDRSGSRVFDLSGSGLHGTYNGSSTIEDPEFGRIMYFDGSYDYVRVDELAPLLAGKSFTVAAWLKPEQKNTQTIFAVNSSGSLDRFQLLIYINDLLSYKVGERRETTSVIADGAWHHVALTHDVDTGLTETYVDGTRVLSRLENPCVIAASDRLSFGMEFDGTSTGEFLKGPMAEAFVFDYVLDQNEIRERTMEAYRQPDGALQFDYPLHAAAAGLEENRGQHAVLHGGPLNADDDTAFGRALVFDGQDDALQLDHLMTFLACRSLSFAVWVRPEPGAGAAVWTLRTSWNAARLRCVVDANGVFGVHVGSGSLTSGATVLTDGRWHHVAVVWDHGGNGALRTFVDGEPELDFETPLRTEPDDRLRLGSNFDQDYFSGRMVDAHLVNRALDAGQIRELMGASLAVDAGHHAVNPVTVDAAADMVLIDPGPMLHPQRLSVSLWFEVRQYDSALTKVIAEQSRAWSVYLEDNKLRCALYAGDGSVTASAASYFAPAPERWYHLAAVYDGTQLQLFVDGTMIDETSIVASLPFLAGPIGIGARPDASGNPTNFCAGRVHHLRLFRAALSPAEVYDVMQSDEPADVSEPPAGSDTALLYLPLDRLESGGTLSPDDSGSGRHAAVHGTTEVVDDVVFGKATVFGASANFLKIEANEISALRDQTVEMWVYPTAFEDERRNPYHQSYAGEGTITLEPDAGLNYYYGLYGVHSSNSTARKYMGFRTAANLALNAWTHIAVVRDLKARRLRWYINGSLDREGPAEFDRATASGYPITIGKGYAGEFAGRMAHVRIYDRALSGLEVEADRQADLAAGKRLRAAEISAARPRVLLLLDEQSGDTVFDESGRGYHGSLVGAARIVAESEFGAVLNFEDGGALDFTTDRPPIDTDAANVTFSIHVEPPSDLPDARSIVGLRDANGVTTCALFRNDRRFEFHANFADTTLAPLVSPEFDPNHWHHVAASYDGTTARLFIDGQLVDERAGELNAALVTDDTALHLGGAAGSGFQGRLAVLRVYDRALGAPELADVGARDRTARSQFRATHPVSFDLLNDDDNAVVFIDDDGHDLKLELTNTSDRVVTLPHMADADAHAISLGFRPGTLAVPEGIVCTTAGWTLSPGAQSDNEVVFLHLNPDAAGGVELQPQERLTLHFENVRALPGAGARNSRVELAFVVRNGSTELLQSSRYAQLSVVNHQGRRNIPLHAGFSGDNGVWSEAGESTNLVLELTNISLGDLKLADDTRFTIGVDATDLDISGAALAANAGVTAELQVDVLDAAGARQGWTAGVSGAISLAPGAAVKFILNNVKVATGGGVGHANILLHYENVPGYWDGQFVFVAEKRPFLITDGGLESRGVISASTLNVGSATQEGSLTVNGSAQARSLTVSQALQAKTLTLGDVTEAGALTVHGAAQMKSLTIGLESQAGALTVRGAAETGALTVRGEISVSDHLEMLPASLPTGALLAAEDGYIHRVLKGSLTGVSNSIPLIGAETGAVFYVELVATLFQAEKGVRMRKQEFFLDFWSPDLQAIPVLSTIQAEDFQYDHFAPDIIVHAARDSGASLEVIAFAGTGTIDYSVSIRSLRMSSEIVYAPGEAPAVTE